MKTLIGRVAGTVGGAGAIAVLLLASGAAPLAAQQPSDGTPQRVIRVSGAGEVRVTPDVAHIDLAVETTGATARAAGEQNARQMDAVIRALTQAGIARADIRTSGYTLFPVYAQQERPPRPETVQEPRIVGYRASNMVNVRTQDIARVGTLIDAALAAGANRMQALRFSILDDEAAQNAAVRQAAERARRSAEAMAAALGVRLGEVVEASTSTDVIRPFMRMEAAAARGMADMAAPTPIEPGEQTVSANVAVVFAIQGG
jgi:uncharacterized protein